MFHEKVEENSCEKEGEKEDTEFRYPTWDVENPTWDAENPTWDAENPTWEEGKTAWCVVSARRLMGIAF